MEGKELTDVFLKLRLDCPEIFFVSGFHFRYYPDSANVELSPEYLFDKNKIKDHQKAMKARVEKLVRPAVTMAELEKEQYVHDFICQNVRYDKLKKSYSHEILGPLGQGVGVCEGIAKDREDPLRSAGYLVHRGDFGGQSREEYQIQACLEHRKDRGRILPSGCHL